MLISTLYFPLLFSCTQRSFTLPHFHTGPQNYVQNVTSLTRYGRLSDWLFLNLNFRAPMTANHKTNSCRASSSLWNLLCPVPGVSLGRRAQRNQSNLLVNSLTFSVRLATFSHVYMVRIRSWATSGGTNLSSRASWTALSSASTRAEMFHTKKLIQKFVCDIKRS